VVGACDRPDGCAWHRTRETLERAIKKGAGLTDEQVRSLAIGRPTDPCWSDPADAAVLRAVKFNDMSKRAGIGGFVHKRDVITEAAVFLAKLVKWLDRLIELAIERHADKQRNRTSR